MSAWVSCSSFLLQFKGSYFTLTVRREALSNVLGGFPGARCISRDRELYRFSYFYDNNLHEEKFFKEIVEMKERVDNMDTKPIVCVSLVHIAQGPLENLTPIFSPLV
ncbi:hypothetical protein chiPu_0021245 [Chiloscyllium punctatum]|uniref:Uncharacterized protein n=1 Tax=Chiloscyllium punctatum TaxID=137246 RepID=A0A401RPH3_CHIPU|nr:hypothetical protein [Chiloscyllium punctatum]